MSKTRKALAVLLSIIMLIGLIPTSAIAFANTDRLAYDVEYNEDFTEATVEIRIASGEGETLTKFEVDGEDVTEQIDDGTLLFTTNENRECEIKATFTKDAGEEDIELTVVVDRIQTTPASSDASDANIDAATLPDDAAATDSESDGEDAGDEPDTASPEEARRSLGDMLGSSGPIMSAEELFEAVNAAADGDTLTLGADISYDWAVLGTMVVSKAITLDFNGYKLTVTGQEALFNVSGNGSLTLVNAEISSSADVIGTNDGTVTVESTAGGGIESEEDFVYINNGSVVIEDGTFKCGNSMIDVTNEGGSLTVKSGTFTAGSYCFDDIYGTGDFYDITVYSESDAIYVCDTGTVNVYGGTYEADGNCIDNSGTVSVYGGSFTSPDEVVYNYGSMTLYGGTFVATSEAGTCFDDDGSVTIAEGYKAMPEDWESASEVRVVPDIVTVNFYSEGVLYETQTGRPYEITFPVDPSHSQGYTFLFWEDNNGKIVEGTNDLSGNDTDLYAVFNDRTHTVTFDDKGTITTQTVTADTPLGQVPGMDRTDDGDGFYGWLLDNDYIDGSNTSPIYQYGDITLTAVYSSGVVTNYDELMQALADKREAIVLGADIETPDTVAVDYDCTIDGNGFGLIRPVGFEGALLSVKNGVTGGEDDPGVDTDGTKLIARNIYVDGSNLDAFAAAVYVSSGTTLIMKDSTIKDNHTTLSWGYSNQAHYCGGSGGGMYIEGSAHASLTGCTVSGNVAVDDGGGVYGASDSYPAGMGPESLTLDGCRIINNRAGGDGGGVLVEGISQVDIADCLIEGNRAGDEGGGLGFNRCYDDVSTTVNITDSVIRNNEAANGGGLAYGYSLVHLYGTTSIEHNNATGDGGGAHCLSSGEDYSTILYLHDSSSIAYNEAAKDGGGVHNFENTVVMYADSCIHHNTAAGDGGGVYALSFQLEQRGGTIRDNHAGGRGGGVYNENYDTVFVSGMIYDNTADVAGDDLFKSRNWELYATQPSRMYGDGDSLALGTVGVEPIAGYHHEPPLNAISVPWLGWFIDGTYHREQVPSSWDPNYMIWQYVFDEGTRYTTPGESVIVSAENVNLDFLKYGLTETGGKAIWYGLLLAYDANYVNNEGTTDYQYDAKAYVSNTNASVLDNMFVRPGYRFTGWNTEADGSGDGYSAEAALLMSKSQVLYAQWEKLPVGDLTVSKTVSGNAADAAKEFAFTVTLSDTTISGTYGDVSFENGVATFTLKGGESKTAEGLLAGVEYVVEETDYTNDGYVTEKTGDTGTIDENTPAVASFTNTRNTYGSLTVTKTVGGNAADATKEFAFTVTISDTTISGTYGDVSFENGVATFVLKGGESKTASSLPNGVGYAVTENDYTGDGYVTVKTGDTGAVVGNETQTAAFTNTRNAEGSLTVAKTVEGNDADTSKEFSFTITLSDTTISGAFGDVTFENGVATFTLKGGESKLIEGLPNGTGYTVEEADYRDDGYVTEKTGDTGTIDENAPAVAVFTNTRNTYGNLTVSKTVSGDAADTTKAFTFTVTLSDTSISGEHGDMTFENGIATFTLKGGESKTASSLPNGMGYTVKEADYSSDGYVTTKTGDTGEIVGGETATAAFTNTKNSTPPEDPDDPPVTPETGSLTISKTVTGTAGEKDKQFTFTVTLGAEGSFEYTGSKSGTITSGGTVQLKHGESITISGIPAETSYMVAESDNEGYEVTKTGDTGTIAADTAATASFTNKKDAAPVTPPDKPGDPGTPKTGDDSNIALWLSLLLASFIGIMVCLVKINRKNRRKRA